MEKVLFIDRDGTLIQEPEDKQIDSFEKLEFLPEVFFYLRKIQKELDYSLVMVSNQDGLGTDSFPENTFHPVQNFIIQAFKNESITFSAIHIDPSLPEENSPNRKPNTGMLTEYIESKEVDLSASYVIGDRDTDLELAQNLGSKGILISSDNALRIHSVKGESKTLELAENSAWHSIYNTLKLKARQVNIERKTKETDIRLSLNLDGTGKSEIQTGLAFFDHMLDQLAKHGNLDIQLTVAGDLEVDEHHTIEDTAIVLGEAFASALGNKMGIERYGFYLPMDDCLASVAIDFGGRNWLVWEADFKREKIGEMPTEMFMHFFKSFSDGAKANLNIKAEGDNEHHKIESIFKAWAKAIKAAIKRDPEKMILPTTKGML